MPLRVAVIDAPRRSRANMRFGPQHAAALCVAAMGLALYGSSAQAAVKVRRGSITIPTYLLGEEDPNPAFPITGRNVYPYTMLDDLTNQRELRTYRTIVLENEFLKAIILPGVGGRLYSLYDKVNHREVFYRNHVMKYGLVGLRGAWISGGVEFNFPNGHTTDTVSPVASATRVNPDGSASAIVGDVDLVSGMHWEVTLTLRPEAARIEQQVKLVNSTPFEEPYWFWANAAVPATEDLQYIYPTREVNPHSREEIWTYPIGNGVDYSWYKNIREATSLFARQTQRNFFGAYYHASDFAVVHVADFRQDPGKKIWTWGVADDGLIWSYILTDADGPYNEIQSGRFETQLEQEFMPPREVESWTEYWYPVRGLGGNILEATPGLALNVVPRESSQTLRLCFAATVPMARASIEINQGERPLAKLGPVSFSPGATQCFNQAAAHPEKGMKSLQVRVLNADGKVLLGWDGAAPIDGNPDFVPAPGFHALPVIPRDKMSAEELYLSGVQKDKGGQEDAGASDYEAALKRDPGYIPALLKRAEYAYRQANVPLAERYVARALARDGTDPRIHYLAGVIYRAGGRLTLAQDAFWAAIQFGGPPAPALLELGELAIEFSQYGKAQRLLEQALRYNPGDPVAETDLAISERLAGRLDESRQTVAATLEQWPIFPFARAEQWRIEQAAEHSGAGQAQKHSEWDKSLTPGSETCLNLAVRYRDLGDLRSSDRVLEFARQRLGAGKISPLVDYYLASNARQEGERARTGRLAQQAAAISCDKVFPSRFEDALMLAVAAQNSPLDAHPLYLFGDYLFAHGRYDDADQLWLRALGLGFENSVLYRNLGVYAWRVKHDLAAAAGYYASAIRLRPDEYRLYVDLDEIDEERDDLTARDKLFQGAPPSVLNRDTLRARVCLLDVQEGKFQPALQALENHRFKPWEGGQIVHELYVAALIADGRKALAVHNPQKAEAAFRQALEYPEHLGVGKPDKPDDDAALYWLGAALEMEGKSGAAQATWKRTVAEHEARENSLAGPYSAMALERLGQSKEAEQIFAFLVKRSQPPDATAGRVYTAGLIERFQKNEPAAIADFNRALKLDPAFWQAHLELNEER